MAETITKKITAVHENGFKVEGYENYFNLSNSYQGIPIPHIGTEIEFTYKPWTNKAGKIIYYVDEIIPVTQVAVAQPPDAAGGPLPSPPAASYAGMQAAAVPSSAPVAQAPRTEPEPLPAGPVLGTQAYRDISIPKQVALKTAIDLLVGTYGGTASDEKAHSELTRLALNAMVMAEEFYEHFLNNSEIGVADVAMPDDTLVPTPSEMDGDPGPVEPR